MIDNFAMALTHALLLLAAWRMLNRADLDSSEVAEGTPVNRPQHRLHVPAQVPAHSPANAPAARTDSGADGHV